MTRGACPVGRIVILIVPLDGWPSGLRRTPGKRVDGLNRLASSNLAPSVFWRYCRHRMNRRELLRHGVCAGVGALALPRSLSTEWHRLLQSPPARPYLEAALRAERWIRATRGSSALWTPVPPPAADTFNRSAL